MQLHAVYFLAVLTHNPRRQRGLRRNFEAARLLGFSGPIPPWVWLSVYCQCCVSSRRCLRLADLSYRGYL
jgi:hypothetical protein